MIALDPPGRSDAVDSAVTDRHAHISSAPSCLLPTKVRAVTLDADALAYLADQGWPAPSATAVVATFSACPGLILQFPDGHVEGFVIPHDFSVVVSGRPTEIPPFGAVLAIDGRQPCGPVQLTSACGG